MIITILFSIFTVYNSPFFRPSGRRRAVGGAHAVSTARASPGRMAYAPRPVCKKTVFSWWGKPVAAAAAVRLGFQVQCLPWSSAVVAVCSRKFCESPQSSNRAIVYCHYWPSHYRRRSDNTTANRQQNRSSAAQLLTVPFGCTRQDTVGSSSACRREFPTLESTPPSHPHSWRVSLVYYRCTFF